jgi:hypothetical protein
MAAYMLDNHDVKIDFAQWMMIGIGLDEVLLFVPGAEGTIVTLTESHKDIRRLLQGGLSLAGLSGP